MISLRSPRGCSPTARGVGHENLPLFGPDRLTPDEMEQTMSDVLGRPVAYRQTRGGLRRKHGLTWPDVGADEQTIPE